MSPEERKNHSYIGDGVYAEFEHGRIWLRTGDHRDELCDNKICLEIDVLNSLFDFADFHLKTKKPEAESDD